MSQAVELCSVQPLGTAKVRVILTSREIRGVVTLVVAVNVVVIATIPYQYAIPMTAVGPSKTNPVQLFGWCRSTPNQ
eukprot:5615665-Heterocapsa_arctica.AAC.1